MRKQLFSIIALLAISLSSYAQPVKPNIIFFLVDDLGYTDLGCYGSNFYETPAIDQLASEGIKFTNGYEAAPRCVESRTSIMSGMYNYRPENDYLNAAQTTWAEALKANGYATFFTGKWHLGQDEATENPEHQGFDVNIAGGHHGSPPTYFFPYQNATEGQLPTIGTSRHANFIGANGAGTAPATGEEDEYVTDRLTWETLDWMNTHVTNNPNQPFVIELAHYGVHDPLEAKADDIAYFQTKKNGMTFTGPATTYELTGETKMHHDNPTYAAMIKSVDDSMASLRAKLTQLGIADNTIIIVTSDNGGLSTCPINSGRVVSTSNKPLKTGKGWLYEGGIKVPLIVYHPGASFAHNVTEDTPVVGVDFYPTLMDLTGTAKIPTQHKDGLSFYDALLPNNTYTRAEPIIIDYNFAKDGTGNPSMAMVRDGNYKLVELKYNWQYELYDLSVDPGETNDLSASNPTKLAELKKKLFDKRRAVGCSHEVTNAGFIATNKEFYDNMNAVTGSNVQATEICGAPASNSIVRNGDFECFYDINWTAGKVGTAAATLVDGAGSQYAGSNATIVRTTTTTGVISDTRLDNKVYDVNVNGKTIVCSVYAKSPEAGAQMRFHLKTTDMADVVKTYAGTTYTLTNGYVKYTNTFTMDAVDTKDIQLRIQCGKVVGDIYFDNVKATYLNTNEVIVNKDFENGHDVVWALSTGGSAVATYADAESGARTGVSGAKIAVTTAGTNFGQSQITNSAYTLPLGHLGGTLNVTGYAKTLAGKPFRVRVNFTGAVSPTFVASSDITTTTSYGQFSQNFTIPQGATAVTVVLQVGRWADTYYFDDLDGTVSVTLKDKKLDVNEFSIYQSDNLLHIKSSEDIYKVSLLDASGKQVKVVRDFPGFINVASLEKGVYLVEIELENGLIGTQKIIIE